MFSIRKENIKSNKRFNNNNTGILFYKNLNSYLNLKYLSNINNNIFNPLTLKNFNLSNYIYNKQGSFSNIFNFKLKKKLFKNFYYSVNKKFSFLAKIFPFYSNSFSFFYSKFKFTYLKAKDFFIIKSLRLKNRNSANWFYLLRPNDFNNYTLTSN